MTDGTGYAGMAEAWAAGAALAYGPLAQHLVDRAPARVDGALALDAGAGSGVAGDALRARGAHVVAADREFDMAAYAATSGPAVTADVTALPFRDASFDVVVAAFVVNHLPDPAAGLAELRRVTRPGGAVLASTFSGDRAAAKFAVDAWPRPTASSRRTGTSGSASARRASRTRTGVERAVAAGGFAEWTVDRGGGRRRPHPTRRTWCATGSGCRTCTGSRRAADGVRSAFVADAVEAVRRTGERFAPIVVEAVAVA